MKNKDCLKTTLENIQKMLSHSIENEELPDNFLTRDQALKFTGGHLSTLSMVMENVGHFLKELKKTKYLRENIFSNNSFVMILEHASLYFFVLNQTECALFYRQLMNDHMSKVKGQNLYKPKFSFPLENDEKKTLCQLMEPADITFSSLTLNERESLALTSKEEGNFYIQQKKFSQAIEAYNLALEVTD